MYDVFSVEDDAAAGGRNMAPMTKEEWEKQQSVVRKVYDPESGRERYVYLFGCLNNISCLMLSW